METVGGGDTHMADMLDQGGDMMEGLDEILPMNIDMRLNNAPDPRTYSTNEAQLDPQQQLGNEANEDSAVTNGMMTGAGAGPLPTGFGTQTNVNGGSTLTDFTKRRNWSQRVLEELKDFLHILTPDGRILYVSPSAESLTGYTTRIACW